jgi:hypothetical protein
VTRATNVSASAPTPSALSVYNVADSSANSTVFITSANFTQGQALNETNKPYGNKGFIVLRKGGDGAVFQERQATNTSIFVASDFPTKLQ